MKEHVDDEQQAQKGTSTSPKQIFSNFLKVIFKNRTFIQINLKKIILL